MAKSDHEIYEDMIEAQRKERQEIELGVLRELVQHLDSEGAESGAVRDWVLRNFGVFI